MTREKSSILAIALLLLAGVSGSLLAKSEPTAAAPTTTQNSKISTEEFLVLACNDGDTCRVKSASNATIRIRLVGIDAPELAHKKKSGEGQPMGLDAKDFLNNRVKGRKVQVRFLGTDAYDRNLGEILVEGENVNLKLVREGLAEVYRGKPPTGLDTDPYLKAEGEARKEKKGIWGLANYQSPKDFRKKNR